MDIKSTIQRMQAKDTLIGIIGMGYVGLPLAYTFLKAGFRVLGFDVDITKIDSLNQGCSYIAAVSSDNIAPYIQNKSFSATDSLGRLREPDVVIICVPTPLTSAREPDLSYIISTSETIAANLRKGQIVVLESTTYPGTTEEVVLPILQRSSLSLGDDFCLGFSPERENPGCTDYNTKTIPKIVSGLTQTCRTLITYLYSLAIDKVIPVSTTQIAEMTKLVENIYRNVNIALVNELKMLCHRMKIDVHEVLDAAATKPFGFQKFTPGPGLGGHCIPLDPFYLTWKARQFDFTTRFIELAGEVNTNMPYYVVQRTTEGLNTQKKSIQGSSILVVGIAYKKDVDDMRESPALKIISLLNDMGAKVIYHDPYIPVLPRTRHYQFDMQSVPLTQELLSSIDCTLIITDHTSIDYNLILDHSKLVVDSRGIARKYISESQCLVVEA